MVTSSGSSTDSAAGQMGQQKRLEHQRQEHRAGHHAGVELVNLDVLFVCGLISIVMSIDRRDARLAHFDIMRVAGDRCVSCRRRLRAPMGAWQPSRRASREQSPPLEARRWTPTAAAGGPPGASVPCAAQTPGA